ncbi:unnamed protein product [Spirodela intermedia]|uniref:Zinc finger C3HC4 RING-type domain-containing protein n=1 Tax=Spirodela intermedia TaxID=51605 RepID=A0A7I8IYF5_SPIIN|nr:unnamed protein product [Spirodela intermedia]CAA6662898.1 unnamed protein product [Spirodela intermedia]
MEVHYINSGFPYVLAENFLDLFEGLAYIGGDASLSRFLHYQPSSYCSSMHIYSYKYGSSCPRSDFCYEMVWDGSAVLSDEETLAVAPYGGRVGAEPAAHASDEERIQSHNHTGDPQEFPDIGVATGTKSRGLPEELILSLPTSKCKRWFFSRKKSRGERAAPLQMCDLPDGLQERERQMILPCRHRYHVGCISRCWASTGYACPICLAEVFAEKRQCP